MIEAEGLTELQGCIQTSRGSYQWNPALDCSVDVFEVSDLSEKALQRGRPESRGRLYEEIVNLYKGRLLPQFATEPWVESVSVRLHGQYRTAILGRWNFAKSGAKAAASYRCAPTRLSWTPTRSASIWEEIVRWNRAGRHTEAQDLPAAATQWAACTMPLTRDAPALPTARCVRRTATWRASFPA